MDNDARPTVVHVIHSLEGGGTERTLLALLRSFDSRRLRHVVATLRSAGTLAAQLPDHVGCCALGAEGRARGGGFRLARIIRQWRSPIIHARNTGCWGDALVAAALVEEAQLVLGFHGLAKADGFSWKQRTIARAGQFLGGRFTTVSDAGCGQLVRQAGVAADRIDVLRNGVDTERFRVRDTSDRREALKSLGIVSSGLVIGSVGSLTPVKGYGRLLCALARLIKAGHDIRLLLVGEGPARAELEQLARTLHIAHRVHLIGQREDIPAVFSGMDVYVCSSESEGMSNALLEALACGLGVVATDAGSNAEVVRHEVDGLIVGRLDEAGLADAIGVLCKSPALRDRLGASARERALTFRFEHVVEAYENYYERLAGAARRGPERSPADVCPLAEEAVSVR